MIMYLCCQFNEVDWLIDSIKVVTLRRRKECATLKSYLDLVQEILIDGVAHACVHIRVDIKMQMNE